MNQQKKHNETLEIISSCFVFIDLVFIHDADKGIPPNVVVEVVVACGYHSYK